MSSPRLTLVSLALAFGSISCQSDNVGYYTAAGYSPRDSYHRGFADGRGDRRGGQTHNPHISRSDTLPSAHRTEYVWGYNEGYKYATSAPNYGAFSGSK